MDAMLDMVHGVVEEALVRSDLKLDVGMEKDYLNFRLILKLQSWTTVNLDDPFPPNSQFSSNDGSFPLLNLKKDFFGENRDDVPLEERFGSFAVKRDPDIVQCNDSTNSVRDVFEPSETFPSNSADEMDNPFEDVIAMESPELASDEKAAENREEEEKEEIVTKPAKRRRTVNGKKKQPTVGEKTERRKKYGRRRSFKCEFCSHTTDCMRRLTKHVSTHSDEKPIKCTLCDFRCKREDLLREHVTIHTGEKPFKCNVCDYETRRSGNLRTHKKLKHGEKEFSCKHCDYTSQLKRIVRAHERNMHRENNSKFFCDLCLFKTMNEKRFRYHQMAHEQNVSFHCNVCGKTYVDKTDFKLHMKGHEKPKKNKRVPCPECDETFCSLGAMRSHLFIHTGKKDFRCRLCGLEFRIFPSQLKHHRRKHPDQFIFHCDLCNFSTNDVKENKRHDISLMHLNNTSGMEPSVPPEFTPMISGQ